MHEISRRAAIRILSAASGAASLTRAADPPLKFRDLDHIEFTVADVERSLAFYTRVFGNAVMKNNQTTRRYIKIGPNYIAIDKAANARVDHFCAGLDHFDIQALHTLLSGQGIAYRDYPSGKDLSIADPDMIRTQLAASNGWAQLALGTASPEIVPSSAPPIFRATGLEGVLLRVANGPKSAAFYRQILASPTLQNFPGKVLTLSQNVALAADGNGQFTVNPRPEPARVPIDWFQVGTSRIGLEAASEERSSGVRSFRVAAQPFEIAAVSAQLRQLGATMETPFIEEGVQFRDPDGFSVQVIEQPV